MLVQSGWRLLRPALGRATDAFGGSAGKTASAGPAERLWRASRSDDRTECSRPAVLGGSAEPEWPIGACMHAPVG